MISPRLEEDLNYDKIFAEKLEKLTASYALDRPEFKTPSPVDPAFKILSELSMTELMLRTRINAAAISQLLKFSEDLDFVLFGSRREGEDLEAFRERIRKDLHKASPAGSLEMYTSLALAAANQEARSLSEFKIVDAITKLEGEKIAVYLQPNPLMSIDTQKVLAEVLAFLTREDILPALDTVEVKLATSRPINISAEIKLSSGKGLAFFDELKIMLTDTIKSTSRLGWSLPLSWLYARLHTAGVESVKILTPISDISVKPEEYVTVNTITLKVAAP